ncbi:hypothetical protein SMC26_40895 [Actinomadura fulvescens]|uniref:Uncharacterized protein n=1 Tax=Actinomadura fulvescens TaxID=46160 RepID=A0ABN3QZ81_9ACTN
MSSSGPYFPDGVGEDGAARRLATAADGPKATPLKMLPVVLGAFEEAGKARLHPRIVDLVLSFVQDEAETKLGGELEMEVTAALKRALSRVRPMFARHLGRQGYLLGTADEVTRDAERRVRLITASGPHGPDAK